VRKLVTSILCATAALCVVGFAQAAEKPVLISNDCADAPYKPAEILIACADAGLRFEASEWTRWDAGGARASGEFFYRDCASLVPAYKCHHFSHDPATVKLYRPRFCSTKGRRFFTRLRLSDPAASDSNLRSITLTYVCRYVS